MTEISIDLTSSGRADFTFWAVKKEAATVLTRLRGHGLNVEDCVRIHPASTRFFRGWVIARPDHLAEMTWLMRKDGTWARGRLWDGWDAATWEYHPTPDGSQIPPTFTHVTRVVPYHGRIERYRTKSNGSCGRWVTADDSVSICTCGWTRHGARREEARGLARAHREEAARDQTRPTAPQSPSMLTA